MSNRSFKTFALTFVVLVVGTFAGTLWLQVVSPMDIQQPPARAPEPAELPKAEEESPAVAPPAARPAPTPPRRPGPDAIEPPVRDLRSRARPSEKPNLVINGDFSEHWSRGWAKSIGDRAAGGNFLMENTASPSDPEDQLLHGVLTGQNSAWVEQAIVLPPEKSLRGLQFRCEVKLLTHPGGGFGLPEPIESHVVLQFQDAGTGAAGRGTVGELWYSGSRGSPFEGTGLLGVPQRIKGGPTRCVVPLSEGYHRIRESLYEKFLDSFSHADPRAVRQVLIVVFLASRSPRDGAEFFLDNVKLFYDDAAIDPPVRDTPAPEPGPATRSRG